MRYAIRAGLGWSICIGLLACVLAPPSPALADEENEAVRFLRDYMHPDYMHRDMPHFVTWLELDESQRVVIEVLLGEYRESFDAELDEILSKLATLNPRGESERARAEFEVMAEQMAMERDRFEATRRRAEAGGSDSDDQEVADRMKDMERRIQNLEERMAQLEVQAREARRDPPAELLKEVAGIADRWAAIKKRLKLRFDTDLLAILAEHQAAPWDRLQRHLRRDHRLPFGEYAGEKTCLLPLIDDLNLEDTHRRAIATVLEAYEIELDRALYDREMGELDVRARYVRAMATEDSEAMIDAVEDESALRVRVRDAHLHALDNIVAMLPEDSGADLRRAFDEHAFPSLTRGTASIDMLVNRALSMELHDDTVEAVLAESASIRARMEVVEATARRGVLRYQPEEMIRQVRRQAGVEDESSTRKLTDVVTRFDRDKAEGLRAVVAMFRRLLTTEQFETLDIPKSWWPSEEVR